MVVADGMHADSRHVIALTDHVDLGLDAENAQQRRSEVAQVAVGVEADQVGAEQAFEEGFAFRQDAEHVAARERRVQEEADAQVASGCAQHARQQEEVEVVDPHGVTRPGMREHHLGKALVDGLVVGKPIRADRDAARHRVQQGPQRAVGVALVVGVDLLPAQENRREVQFAEALTQLAEIAELLGRGAGPADPEGADVGSREARRQPALRPFGPTRGIDSHGQAIRDQNCVRHGSHRCEPSGRAHPRSRILAGGPCEGRFTNGSQPAGSLRPARRSCCPARAQRAAALRCRRTYCSRNSCAGVAAKLR